MLNHHILLFVLIFVCWPRGEEYDATKEIRHIKVSGMRQCSAQWTNLYTLQTICVIGSSVWFIFMYSFIFLFFAYEFAFKVIKSIYMRYVYDVDWHLFSFYKQCLDFGIEWCIDHWSLIIDALIIEMKFC